jgi:hypothetical protein
MVKRKDCKDPTVLIRTNTPVSDAGLAHNNALKNLKRLEEGRRRARTESRNVRRREPMPSLRHPTTRERPGVPLPALFRVAACWHYRDSEARIPGTGSGDTILNY